MKKAEGGGWSHRGQSMLKMQNKKAKPVRETDKNWLK